MPVKHLYEYAVIRVVPVVEREEFINAGVLLFCKSARYIRLLHRLDEQKLMALCPDSDCEFLREALKAFERIAKGEPEAGPIARLDEASRFRWLTAVKSAAIQTSRPHPGLCDHLDETAERLFREMVGGKELP